MPSHRRSGGSRGRGKRRSLRWRLQWIEDESRRAAELLQLQQWPPDRCFWDRAYLRRQPRRPGARLSRARRDALIDRLDALESLRIWSLAPVLTAQIEAMGRSMGALPSDLRLRLHLAVVGEEITRWAVRRPASDPRSWRDTAATVETGADQS
jgi:hypothetical protein